MIKCGQCNNRIAFPVYKTHFHGVITSQISATNSQTSEKQVKGYYPHCPFCGALLVPLETSELNESKEKERNSGVTQA